MPFEFEAIDVDDLAQLTVRTRTSKWRENLAEFMAADIPAARVATDDDENKPGSVSSGINNAIKLAEKAGSPVPVAVKTQTATDGTKSVYLIRTDMVDLKAARRSKDEASDEEPAVA